MTADAADALREELLRFDAFGAPTRSESLTLSNGRTLPRLCNEYWTSQQRQAHSLHEISYRACFKPQLPRFFIDRLTTPGAVVYDPFMGRGTTVLEAAFSGRGGWGSDINPLAPMLLSPRLSPPELEAVQERLGGLDLESPAADEPEDLLVFFHPATLRAICSLREYLFKRDQQGSLDNVDAWIRMVTANRLSGHSGGFLSVYTLPPNQAVSVESQRRINERRGQTPPLRDLREVVLKKSRSLLRHISKPKPAYADYGKELADCGPSCRLSVSRADVEGEWPAESVDLVVTSPPFLDVVDYAADNWLRAWFCGVDKQSMPITRLRSLQDWDAFVERSLTELRRLLKPRGHIAFEVGEVRKGSLDLERVVADAGMRAGLQPRLVLVNEQVFTKTAQCWGIDNNQRGTNSNRVVLFSR